jgi:ABC-type multidrug transport system permease subunit
MSEWIYVVLLGLLIGSTLFIPVYRWLALLTNVVFYIGMLAGYLTMHSTGVPLGYGWSTLVFILVSTGISVHVFAWFMSGINRSNSSS